MFFTNFILFLAPYRYLVFCRTSYSIRNMDNPCLNIHPITPCLVIIIVISLSADQSFLTILQVQHAFYSSFFEVTEWESEIHVVLVRADLYPDKIACVNKRNRSNVPNISNIARCSHKEDVASNLFNGHPHAD